MEIIAHFEEAYQPETTKTFLFIPISPKGSGTVSGNGELIGDYINNHEIKAFPSEGFEFSHWETTDSSVTLLDEQSSEATISFAGQTKLIIKAVFKKLPQTFRLSLTSSHADRGSVSGSGNYEEGKYVNIYAIPQSGYEFFGWLGVGNLNKQTANSEILIEFDTSLIANFRPIVDRQVIDPMRESTDLGNGWKANPWFGFYWKLESSNWSYHQSLGWIYLHAETDGSIWLWISRFDDWFWTNEEVYPYLYAPSLLNEGWYFLDTEKSSPRSMVIYKFGLNETESRWLSK